MTLNIKETLTMKGLQNPTNLRKPLSKVWCIFLQLYPLLYINMYIRIDTHGAPLLLDLWDFLFSQTRRSIQSSVSGQGVRKFPNLTAIPKLPFKRVVPIYTTAKSL